MFTMTSKAILKLLESESPAALTLYMPTHPQPAPKNMREDQIRFKNLLTKAIKLPEVQASSKLKQLLETKREELLGDQEFWKNQAMSLLLCADEQRFEVYHLPFHSEEYIAVDTTFHLAPVLAMLPELKNYYVLAVAMKEPRLYIGDQFGLQESTVKLPQNPKEALGIDEIYQKSVQFQPANNGVSGMFHGHGGAKDAGESEKIKFYRLIDNLINRQVDKNLPLILAGAEQEIACYRELSHYPKLLRGTIHGNYSHQAAQKLRQPAWQIIESEIINPEKNKVIEEMHILQGAEPGRVISDNETITAVSHEGRIKTLLLSLLRRTRDTVQDSLTPQLGVVFPKSLPMRLLNQAARDTWLQGGRIINTSANTLPRNSKMVAITRF